MKFNVGDWLMRIFILIIILINYLKIYICISTKIEVKTIVGKRIISIISFRIVAKRF